MKLFPETVAEPAVNEEQHRRKHHNEHTRTRKPKRQGSRAQTGKLQPRLPVTRVPDRKEKYRPAWFESQSRG